MNTNTLGVRAAARSCAAVANSLPSAGAWESAAPYGNHQSALTLSHHTHERARARASDIGIRVSMRGLRYAFIYIAAAAAGSQRTAQPCHDVSCCPLYTHTHTHTSSTGCPHALTRMCNAAAATAVLGSGPLADLWPRCQNPPQTHGDEAHAPHPVGADQAVCPWGWAVS